MRGGTGPEAWRTTFEYSPSVNSWTNLGAGTRIPGGWQLTDVTLPTNAVVRARGFVRASGKSDYFVQSILCPPLIISRVQQSATGKFGFYSSGPAGRSIIIERSSDFASWSVLRTNLLNPGPVFFQEPLPATNQAWFYRLRLAE